MAFKSLVVFLILFFNFVTSSDDNYDDFYKHTHPEEYYDPTYEEESTDEDKAETVKPIGTHTQDIGDIFEHNFNENHDSTLSDEGLTTIEAKATERPLTSYEVTENVIDIPNNETFAAIVANYTINRPLNNATIHNTFNNNNTDNNDDKNKLIKELKNYLSILHIQAGFDDKQPVVQNVNRFPDIIFGLKDYIRGVKKGIIHGLNSFARRPHNDVNHGVKIPNLVASPLLFINKLHRKSSKVIDEVHKAVLGHNADVVYD